MAVKRKATERDIEYRNEYIKTNYDRINVTFPKGKKEHIKKRAANLNMSVNQYINLLVDGDLNNDNCFLNIKK